MRLFTISQKRNYKLRFFLVFVAFMSALFANDAILRDVHIKGDKDFLEILLLLDSTFKNRVVKEDVNDFSALIFKNLNYTKNKLATKSQLIKNIEIFARDSDTLVVLGEKDLDLRFDMSVQNGTNAIKITLKPKSSVAKEMLEIPNEIIVENPSLEDSINAIKAQNQLLTSSNNVESWRYALVIAILLILLIALFVIKKRTQNNKNPIAYFKKPQITITQSINIDLKNKIVVLHYKNVEYMLFVGQNGAFFIDKFESENPKSATEHKIINLVEAYKQVQQSSPIYSKAPKMVNKNNAES